MLILSCWAANRNPYSAMQSEEEACKSSIVSSGVTTTPTHVENRWKPSTGARQLKASWNTGEG